MFGLFKRKLAIQKRAEEKTEIAYKMKRDGMPAEMILKYTGLSKEEIEKL